MIVDMSPTMWVLVGVAVVILLILMFVLRRYFSALLYDKLDLLLSSLDSLLAGAGLVGIDIGDWIVAVIVFFSERKISGNGVALLVAWEAANFIPLSLIPGVGEAIEIGTNFFPAVTISRFLAAKFKKADKEKLKLEREINLAEKANINISEEKKLFEQVRKLIKANDPVDALKKSKKVDRELTGKLRIYVSHLINETQALIQGLLSARPEGSDEMVEILQQAVATSENLLQQADAMVQQKDVLGGAEAVMKAKNMMKAAIQQAGVMMEEYQEDMEEEAQEEATEQATEPEEEESREESAEKESEKEEDEKRKEKIEAEIKELKNEEEKFRKAV